MLSQNKVQPFFCTSAWTHVTSHPQFFNVNFRIAFYKFCKSCGQNGRILPNPILRPAIEAATGIKVGPARNPIAPITPEETEVMMATLREAGKI